ncbi:hypothetical protein JMJ77_0011578, partial [Colletotrichum scovillei]
MKLDASIIMIPIFYDRQVQCTWEMTGRSLGRIGDETRSRS